MDELKLKRLYNEYLDYMYEHDEKYGFYPPHLSNGNWTPFSFEDWLEKTKNGTVEIYN